MKNNKKQPEILLVTRPLTPPWDEASKNFAYQLAKNLDQCKFHILVGEYDSQLPKRITQQVIYRGASWTTLQKTKLVLKLYMLLKRNPGINIVHFLFAPTPFNNTVLRNLVKTFPVKVVQTIASVPRNAREKINAALFADEIVVYSNYAKKQLTIASKNSSAPSKKIMVVPPFIDFAEFPLAGQKERQAAKKKWKIDPQEKIILFPGEYSRLDAIDNILESFALIKKRMPQSRLFMACRTKKKEDLKIERKFKKDVSLAGLSSSVNFLGRVDNIRELFIISDLTIFPANFMEGKSLEGKFDFPFVLLESLASGTPILTSDIAALPEIWQENKTYQNKYLFSRGNVKELAKKSLAILKQDRKTLAKEINQFVTARFNRENTLENYSKIYNSLI
jgi:glycosyltransferase involved in cell wall biosynthesis